MLLMISTFHWLCSHWWYTRTPQCRTWTHPNIPPGRIPAGHTLSWECPILLEANPGTHHRECLARDRWEGLDATGKLLAMPHPVLVSSPLLQGYWVFKTLLFQPLFQKYPGHSDYRLPHFQKSSLGPMHWVLLESSATHPLMLLLPPWQVEHTGSLPWAGWARTPCSWNFVDTDMSKQTWIGWGELYCKQESGIFF